MPTTASPNPLLQPEIDELFPLTRNVIKEGAFELGLVLSGTVSAGAYTGGVVDYLMEAFDAWTAAKEEGRPEAPPHEVVISTIAGTSGGAITGAIIARAAGWSYKHGESDGNPFFSAWTSGVDLMKLLSATPESGLSGLASVLNCSAIDAQVGTSIAFKGGALGQQGSGTPRFRSYFADPVRLTMMLGNITGLPYKIAMPGESGLGHELVNHTDFSCFALTVQGGVPNAPTTRPDEFALSSYSAPNWDRLGAAALATSAFPLAFRSRPIDHPLATCGYRVTLVPADVGDPRVVQLIPKWDTLTAGEPDPNRVNFVSVDGGTVNNDPIDIVRTALAGWNGRNSRDGSKADRAVILVAPFSDSIELGPRQPPGLFGSIGPLVMSLVYQARFKAADIGLAQNPDVYSRFLIAPYGPGGGDAPLLGKDAIASGGLGGFLGFVDARFLKYDYRLGRRNAYEFLFKELVFPDTNPIFENWTDQQKADQTSETKDGVRYLRLVPLMPALRANPPAEMKKADWPGITDVPATLGKAIESRLDAIYQAVTTDNLSTSGWSKFFASSYLKIGWTFARPILRDKALDVIRTALRVQKLMPP
jgi:hypothetical protein